MINMHTSFSVAEIWGSKSKNLIFYEISLNTDISITNQDIAMKFSFQLRGESVSDFLFRP